MTLGGGVILQKEEITLERAISNTERKGIGSGSITYPKAHLCQLFLLRDTQIPQGQTLSQREPQSSPKNIFSHVEQQGS